MKIFKTLAMCLVLASAVIIPLACGNSNNTPATPIGGSAPTATRTATTVGSPGTATTTPTNTPGGAATPVPTFSTPTPSYRNNYGTGAKPNGLYVNAGTLYVAEGETSVTKLIPYTIGNGSLVSGIDGNQLVYGYPTPTTAWVGTTITLAGPQAYVVNGGSGGGFAVLDSNGTGPATLFAGNNGWSAGTTYATSTMLEPITCTGYDGVAFVNPKGMVMDSGGTTIYVADTGNARIDALSSAATGESDPRFPENWFHYWTSLAPGVPFKTPSAITLDSTDTVWVADSGYSPSVIEAYTSGGTTVLNMPLTTISGCVASGIAVTVVGPNTHVYIADSGNKQVEVYDINATGGTILTACSIPVTDIESSTFVPYSVALAPSGGVSTNVIVGDIGNDKLEVFQVLAP